MAEQMLAERRSEGVPCPSACREWSWGPSPVVSRERAEVLGARLDPIVGSEGLNHIVFKSSTDVSGLDVSEGEISAAL